MPRIRRSPVPMRYELNSQKKPLANTDRHCYYETKSNKPNDNPNEFIETSSGFDGS